MPTALAIGLTGRPQWKDAPLVPFLGAGMVTHFDTPASELDAMFTTAGVTDLGWRGKILVSGRDRIRWMNNMVTNTIQKLPEGQGSYSFLLSPQGKIQGDGYVYRRGEDLFLDTTHSRIPDLLGYLKHYIIMDRVELKDVSEQWAALGLAGPRAAEMLTASGLAVPGGEDNESAHFVTAQFQGSEVIVVRAFHVRVPRYEIWLPSGQVVACWEALCSAGAVPAGLYAAEALRIMEGNPLYGIDLGDRDLAQETGQLRALNFSKGCYLGQEIVERVRSRGKVHRHLQQFTLKGAPAQPPFDLTSGGQIAGRVTSVTAVASPRLQDSIALGMVREEALLSGVPIEYPGGIALPLAAPSFPAA